MKRLFLLLLALTIGTAHATTNHGLPSLLREMMARDNDALGPFVVTGCAPAVPASSLTIAGFACQAYVSDGDELLYVSQASIALTVPDSATVWLAIEQNDVGAAPSGWTREASKRTHYVYQAVAAQPADPTGGLVFAKVTVAASVISAIELIDEGGPIRGWVSVTNPRYGAIPNDGVDDTAAFNSAIASVRQGGTIYVPCGEYNITGLAPTRTIALVGLCDAQSEPEETVPQGAVLTSTTDAIILDFTSVTSAGSSVYNIGLKGSGNVAHTAQDGIVIANNVTYLRNVHVYNTGGDCIEIQHMNLSRWERVKSSSCKRNGWNINQVTAIADNNVTQVQIDTIAESGFDAISCTAGGAFHIFGISISSISSGGFAVDLANCDDNMIYGYHDEGLTGGTQSFNFGATAERNYIQATTYNGTLADAGTDNVVCGYDNNLTTGLHHYCRGKDPQIVLRDTDDGTEGVIQVEDATLKICLGVDCTTVGLSIGTGADTEFIINPGAADRDFLVATDGSSQAFRVRSDNEYVEVNTGLLFIEPTATAPATCTVGAIYFDTSGATCACTSTNTWTNMHGVGTCS